MTVGITHLRNHGAITNLTASWRAVGGCWELRATVEAYDASGTNALPLLADAWLGQSFVHGGWGWSGLIVQCDVTTGRLKRRYSLIERYANRVAVEHASGITAFSEDAVEVAKRGTWELLHSATGLAAGDAAGVVTRLLARNIAEQPFVLGVERSPVETATLELLAIGYLPACARFASGVTQGASTVGYAISTSGENVSTAISGVLVDTDLTALSIETDTTQVKDAHISGRNAWARLEELAIFRGRDAYTLTVDDSLNVTYAAVDTTGITYQLGRAGVTRGGVPVTPQTARPGYYVDTETGTSFYVDEVAWTDGDDTPDLRTADVSSDAYLRVD